MTDTLLHIITSLKLESPLLMCIFNIMLTLLFPESLLQCSQQCLYFLYTTSDLRRNGKQCFSKSPMHFSLILERRNRDKSQWETPSALACVHRGAAPRSRSQADQLEGRAPGCTGALPPPTPRKSCAHNLQFQIPTNGHKPLVGTFPSFPLGLCHL